MEKEILLKDLFDSLGIEYTTSKKQVKRAYMKKMSQLHPDRLSDPTKFKKEEYLGVQNAYQTLITPTKVNTYLRQKRVDANNIKVREEREYARKEYLHELKVAEESGFYNSVVRTFSNLKKKLGGLEKKLK